jgi:guanine nucleotide-binding protein G(i) subunit alpha
VDITENPFMIEGKNYLIYDVGGQKSLRLFWIPYFESQLEAILFVTSLACYDQTLQEDRSINRMNDALELFDKIVNNPLLKNTRILLFLNKMDLFSKKITYSNIYDYHKDFPGKDGMLTVIESDIKKVSLKMAGHFFKSKFIGSRNSLTKKIFVHYTTSTDTTQMAVIITMVRYEFNN